MGTPHINLCSNKFSIGLTCRYEKQFNFVNEYIDFCISPRPHPARIFRFLPLSPAPFSFEGKEKCPKHLLIMISVILSSNATNIQPSADLFRETKHLIKRKYVNERSHDQTFNQTVFSPLSLSFRNPLFFLCLNTCNTISHWKSTIVIKMLSIFLFIHC